MSDSPSTHDHHDLVHHHHHIGLLPIHEDLWMVLHTESLSYDDRNLMTVQAYLFK